MYKRHTGQVSMLESPEMFGSLPLDPNNDWIKLSKFVPWREFDLKYAENFRSKKGQRACDSRMALGSVLIKIHYKGMSDEDLTKEIAMNPYLQYFLGLREYRYECPFDASMMTRFRQRISAEMLTWVNDEIIGRKATAEKEKKEEDHKDDDSGSTGNGAQEESKGGESEEENQGTLILDTTCAPQNIRFPTDASGILKPFGIDAYSSGDASMRLHRLKPSLKYLFGGTYAYSDIPNFEIFVNSPISFADILCQASASSS